MFIFRVIRKINIQHFPDSEEGWFGLILIENTQLPATSDTYPISPLQEHISIDLGNLGRVVDDTRLIFL